MWPCNTCWDAPKRVGPQSFGIAYDGLEKFVPEIRQFFFTTQKTSVSAPLFQFISAGWMYQTVNVIASGIGFARLRRQSEGKRRRFRVLYRLFWDMDTHYRNISSFPVYCNMHWELADHEEHLFPSVENKKIEVYLQIWSRSGSEDKRHHDACKRWIFKWTLALLIVSLNQTFCLPDMFLKIWNATWKHTYASAGL